MSPDLRAGRLTARGEAGIAVFRIRGPSARDVLRRIFAPHGPADLAPGRLRVGRVEDGGAVLDDAVVRIREAADGWEADLATHGSLYVTDRIEAMLRAEGAAALAPDEAWDPATAPGVEPGDRVVADAREGLLASFAELQTVFFLDAMEGGPSRVVLGLERSIAAGGPAGPLLARLDAFAARAPLGLAMSKPPAVVIAGAPNSGKSTLFNALLREARAIASAEPGTTRDVLAEPYACGGYPLRLHDSAGMRASSDPVERLGVAKARDAAARADIVVALIDPTEDLEAQAAIAESVSGRAPRIAVVSKADDAAAAAARVHPRIAALRPMTVSAVSGEGIADLEARILKESAFGGPASLREAAPFTRRHVEGLAKCRAALRSGDQRAAALALARLRREEDG